MKIGGKKKLIKSLRNIYPHNLLLTKSGENIVFSLSKNMVL